MMDRRKFITSAVIGSVLPSLSQAQYYTPTPQQAVRPDVGFIFIGASWCAYCKRAAPILQRLATNSDIPVLVISTDNKPILPFTDFLHDPDHPILTADKRVPRTALWNAATDDVVGVIDGFRGRGAYVRQLQELVVASIQGGLANG